MRLLFNMTYAEIVSIVANNLHLPVRFVDKTYRAYWKAVKLHIEALPLKEDLSDEEFLELQPNVNIPSLGKLNVTLERYHGIKKSYKRTYKKDNNVKNKEN